MRKLAILFLMFTTSVMSAEYKAQETKFTIPTWTLYGSTVYYNCDSVEYKAKDLLQTLGAKNVDVKCTGGIDVIGRIHLPARVSATFETLQNGSGRINATYKEVVFKDFDECHLYNTIYKKVRSNFDMEDDSVRRCLRVNGRTVISAQVLAE